MRSNDRAMSEYDAFGRKRDEAGLGDLGWGASDDPNAPSGPQRTVSTTASEGGLSTPTEFTTVSTGPPPAPRRRRGNPAVWIVQLAVLGAIAFAIYSVVDAGRDTVNDVRGAIEDFNGGVGGGGGGGGGRGDDTVPEQVKPRDLFGSPGDLRQALRTMERELPGKITNFSIHRNGINAQVVRGGERSIVLFAPDAEAPEVITRSEASTVIDAMSYEEINPTAPARLMKAANARLGRSPADVDYFVVSKSSGVMQWGIYYEGGSPIALGDSRGRYTRRIS